MSLGKVPLTCRLAPFAVAICNSRNTSTPAVRGAKALRWSRWSSAKNSERRGFWGEMHNQRRKGIAFSLSRNVLIPSSATVRLAVPGVFATRRENSSEAISTS